MSEEPKWKKSKCFMLGHQYGLEFGDMNNVGDADDVEKTLKQALDDGCITQDVFNEQQQNINESKETLSLLSETPGIESLMDELENTFKDWKVKEINKVKKT